MARYIANAYLTHRGELIKTGDKLDLTDKQAERLGDKVTKLSEATEEEKRTAEHLRAETMTPQTVESETAAYGGANSGETETAYDDRAGKYDDVTVKELRERVKILGIEGYSRMNKGELINAIESNETR